MKEISFTPSQLDAIDISKSHLDTCIVAGPGSGKTTVLVEYFRRLVAAGVDPLRILAITFTEKAAGNMRAKLGEAFREDSILRAKLERAWVSTVHGFCARLLRENAIAAEIDPDFQISDERAAWRVQQESIRAALDALYREKPAAVRALIAGLASTDFEEEMLSAYDAMRGAGVSVEDLSKFPTPQGTTTEDVSQALAAARRENVSAWNYAQRQEREAALEGAQRIIEAPTPLDCLRAITDFSCRLNKLKKNTAAYQRMKELRERIEQAPYSLVTDLYAPQRQFLIEILRRFDHLYRERKRQAGVLDFADLEEYSVRLLVQHSETRERVRAQFDHILMDEFQDTNGQQARLLKLIRPPDRFYAVGDINQSIFGFRHAEPQGFEEYRAGIEQSGRHLVKLDDNFRSRPQILSAVETIAHGLPGIEPHHLVARREFPEANDVCVEAIGAADLDTEARLVAQRIRELSGGAFKDVAVLVRNTEVIPAFTDAFDEAGILYVVNRGKGFYETREVLDLTHLLRVIANPRDEISLAAVLRSPLVEASDEALAQLKMIGENAGASLMRLDEASAAALGPDDSLKLTRFRDRLRDLRGRREHVSFDRLLLTAIDEYGYMPDSGARGMANIEKFLAQAREASGRMALDQFIDELDLLRANNPREPDAPPEDSANAVKIMTVHSAKGLEFPIVFVAALHKGIDTSLPVISFSRVTGLGARWRNPASPEERDKGDLFERAIRVERNQREEHESRRLLYVAMTRAEEHLALTFSGKPKEWAEVVRNALLLDVETARDEVIRMTAPDGKLWKLRISVGQTPVASGKKALSPGVPLEEAELIAAPAITDQQDANATVTAISAFVKCPREYFLQHYLRLEGRGPGFNPDGPADGLAAADLGSQVHALLAGTPVANPDPEAMRLAEVFRQSALGKRLARAGRVEREFDFIMAVEDVVIRGQIDLWFEEGGELVIVDYKTDAVSGMEAHQRAQDYALQLRLYAAAIERMTGRAPDRAWLHFLRPNALVEVDLSPSLLESPEQIVRDFVEAQSKGEFRLNEGPRCKRCAYYTDLCPSAYQA